MTTGTGSGLLAEMRAAMAPAARVLSRRVPEIVLGLAVLITLTCGFALAGAVLDDRAIAANPALAQAEVLEGSTFTRTLVRFTAANGETVVPEGGVFYPRGLAPGSTVAVEYDVTDPDLVRPAGRGAADGILPLGAAVLITWLVLGPVALVLRRRRAGPRAA